MKKGVVNFIDDDKNIQFDIDVSDDLPKGIIAQHRYKGITISPEIAKELIRDLQKAVGIFEGDMYQWVSKKTGRIK